MLEILVSSFARSEKLLRQKYTFLTRRGKQFQQTLSNKWFLENFYLIDAELKRLSKELTPQLLSGLTIIKEGYYKDYPRIYQEAFEYLTFAHFRFDEDKAINFLLQYEGTRQLKSVEIWAFPVLLRLILIETLPDAIS